VFSLQSHHRKNFFLSSSRNLDASKSTKIPFFEKKIEIENFDEKKTGFFTKGQLQLSSLTAIGYLAGSTYIKSTFNLRYMAFIWLCELLLMIRNCVFTFLIVWPFQSGNFDSQDKNNL
jgi:hypothetical protein